MAALLGVAGCGGADQPGNEAAASDAAAVQAEAETAAAETPRLPPCPFRTTSGWSASWEAGRLLVVGQVDLQMAGFKADLSQRSGGGANVLALDLALKPEAGAAVNNRVRFERSGAPAYARTEIWCGGERIEALRTIIVAQ
jgi:hypothetical protein